MILPFDKSLHEYKLASIISLGLIMPFLTRCFLAYIIHNLVT